MSASRPARLQHVHLVVPHDVDDPLRPSGGNVYDRELARALWSLRVAAEQHLVPGSCPGVGDVAALQRTLAELPDGAAVVVDGLIGLGTPEALDAERPRLTVVLLVHLPLALAAPDRPRVRATEQRALDASAGVITTSDWTRRWLLDAYRLDPGRVRVARPGARPGRSARRDAGTELLCVGAVLPAKGHDVLVEALAKVRALPWTCRVLGTLDRDPGFVQRLHAQIRDAGLEDRVRLTGPVPHERMTDAYAAADLLVLPTRLETYGMAVTEALGHEVPVVASDTGGVPEALGRGAGPVAPGILVPPGDADALGLVLRRWLTDPVLRRGMRVSAAVASLGLQDWTTTAERVRDALEAARLNPTVCPTVV